MENLKTILGIMKEFTSVTKAETNYIYYNHKNNELISTDLKRLLIIKLDKQLFDKDYFIDVNNIYKKHGYKSKRKLEDFYLLEKKEIGNFPDYKKIIPSFPKRLNENLDISFPTLIMNIGTITKNDIIIDFDKKYESLSKLDLSNKKYYIDNAVKNNKIVMIEGTINNFDYQNFKIIIIPFEK